MSRRRLHWLLVLTAAALVSACSVSTPRNGVAGSTSYGGEVTSQGEATETGVEGGAGATTGEAGTAASAGGESTAVVSADGTVTSTGAAGTTRTASGGKAGGQPAADKPRSTGSTAPGVTKDSLTISIIAGFSGPLAGVVEKAYGGLLTWQEDINDAGGIHGRKLVLRKVDHKETADGGIAACKQALSNGSFVAMVPEGIEANVTATGCLDAAGMPTLVFAGAADPRWRMAFLDVITTSQAGKTMATYVRASASGTKKIGVIYVNQHAYKALADTLIPEAKRLGIATGGAEAIEPNQASFTSQLLRLRDAGVQQLVISATAEAVGVLRDARAMGWEPQVYGWGFQFDFVAQAGRELLTGVLGLRTNATVDTPAYGRYAARMQARGRGGDRTVDTEGAVAYSHGLLLGKMLEAAGPSPTRASFVQGSEGIQSYDNGLLPPIRFGPGQHIGTNAAFPTICCNSDWTWKGQGPARAAF